MHKPKRWNIAPPHPGAEELAGRLKTSPLIAQILLNRGLGEAEECRQFLRPNLKYLHDPALIPNLPRAAERIARAILDKQKIVIYGDYDVDGITGTAILWHAIRVLGGIVDYYIPHRLEEGYGLNCEAIRQICDGGAGLIVSVDCGITALEPAQIARDRGIDLIITDHHEWRSEGSGEEGTKARRHEGTEGEEGTEGQRDEGTEGEEGTKGEEGAEGQRDEGTKGDTQQSRVGSASADGFTQSSVLSPQSSLNPEPRTLNPSFPDCFAIVHPRLPGDGPAYPNPSLCGAGVAFKLSWGVGLAMSGATRVSETFRAFLLEATALAALGTIADVMPLIGENRVLAYYGLGGLRRSSLVGIKALIASAGLTGQNLDSFHVGFLLAPRLNASGRMGHARLAVEMLTTVDESRALEIATFLEQQNRERQTIERNIFQQADEQVVQQRFADDDRCAIVLGAEGWHPGVVGIVASRIVEKYHRPTVMVAIANGHGQGSARSISGFHLAHALEACSEYLVTHGGHEMAAGLKLETARLDGFREAFCAYARMRLRPEQLIPQIDIECIAGLRDFTLALVGQLNRLGPFGHGNQRPTLVCHGLNIAAPPRRCGKTADHLQLLVRQGNYRMKCIGFGLAHLEPQLEPGTLVDLAVEPVLNEFNGYTTIELEIKDIQFPTLEPAPM